MLEVWWILSWFVVTSDLSMQNHNCPYILKLYLLNFDMIA